MPFLVELFYGITRKMIKQKLDPLELYVIDVVRKKRESLGWTQKELADRLDVSFSFIGDIEGTKRPAKYNIRHINKLAKVFNCSPRDFFPEKPLK